MKSPLLHLSHSALLPFALCSLLACQPAGGPAQAQTAPQSAAMQDIEIRFAAAVNGEAFDCGKSYANVGTSGSVLTPLDFRFYVHNLRLVNAAGEAVPLQLVQDGKWQHQNLALLDFEDKSAGCSSGNPDTNFVVKGKVPAGTYKGLNFTLGVPFELNHQDMNRAASPLNLSSLFWNWRGGYKFTRIDFASTGQPNGYSIHLGSTGCTGMGTTSTMRVQHGDEDHGAVTGSESQVSPPAQCMHPNRSEVTLPDFEPTQYTVVADLGQLLRASNIDVNQPDTASGCMSGPDDTDCQGIFQQLGLPFGDSSAGPQGFFSQQ
ncbi:MAG: metallo-mystery pair system four-Cys motif protein [Candidatus Sericytochromatia bacterium]|nr:metallo-mystery pair system four-Cys motif protein [Candidatus Sericytochromatia bacterium]